MPFTYLPVYKSTLTFVSALVGSSGLEPPTSRLSGGCSNQLSYKPVGGDDGIRTHDPLLAGQVLSQLSYTPILGRPHPTFLSGADDVGFDLFFRTVSGEVSSARQSLTSVFGMGTGGPSALIKPTA